MSELCLKDKTVLTFKDVEGVPGEILKINAPELLPLCLEPNCTMEDILNWLQRRGISSKRDGIEDVKKQFGTDWLINKNYASLSDQYWIKKRTETWKKINFFTNIYSKDIGDMFFSPWSIAKNRIDNFSPDLTLNGILKKRWKQRKEDKTSFLIKAGNKKAEQDPFNEILVSVLVEKMGVIPCVHYDLVTEGLQMCSKCENFITADTELVPASYIYFKEKKKDGETVMAHLIRMCEKYEIPAAEEFIKWLIFIDKITGNADRNLSNIAFIRDINTLKFIGPAPMFDNGNAYWNTSNILGDIKSKEFGDVEDSIFEEMKKKIDIGEVFKKMDYSAFIYGYPLISEVKKENLVEKIKQCNNRINLKIEMRR